ncbi:MAG: UDP-N-acetylglucosamine--N-acetylmuramyl-(pentapeptide) pyrophosphoryl-undecaprenol N-acetylglucosamine transferase [Phycisphaerales bacterium]|nr:UDP-N-acetylglucosamine--N-acetylmuramyl-(pentapeptide) pyrophosphoryl-undecaprenol N-acetylglucosamine transferase [Phycisphaerales bacterium]
MRNSQWEQFGATTVVFAGGGTGGHLYPALAVAEEIRHRRPEARIVFCGSDRRIDEIILSTSGCEAVTQHLPRLSKAPWRWPAILKGYRQALSSSRSLLASLRPSVVIGSGGAASLPVMLQARRVGIPTVLFNPDALPGRANRFLARRADRVLVQWEESVAHFPRRDRVHVTGCPVRPAFLSGDRDGSGAKFGLDPSKKTLLITGASLGARTVNRAVVACLDLVRGFPDWQVLHLTGDADYQEVLKAYASTATSGVVLAYTHDMADALRAADLVVSRAGASTLAELTAMGRPSILLPYPFHRDMHQLANACVLADGGAAVVLKDRIEAARNAPVLKEALGSLLGDEARRRKMADAARRQGRRDAAAVVVDHVFELARQVEVNEPECVKAQCASTR